MHRRATLTLLHELRNTSRLSSHHHHIIINNCYCVTSLHQLSFHHLYVSLVLVHHFIHLFISYYLVLSFVYHSVELSLSASTSLQCLEVLPSDDWAGRGATIHIRLSVVLYVQCVSVCLFAYLLMCVYLPVLSTTYYTASFYFLLQKWLHLAMTGPAGVLPSTSG